MKHFERLKDQRQSKTDVDEQIAIAKGEKPKIVKRMVAPKPRRK